MNFNFLHNYESKSSSVISTEVDIMTGVKSMTLTPITMSTFDENTESFKIDGCDRRAVRDFILCKSYHISRLCPQGPMARNVHTLVTQRNSYVV